MQNFLGCKKMSFMYLIWRSNYFSAGSPAPCLSHLCLHSNSCQGGPWDGKRLKQNTFYKNHTNSGTVCEMKTECQRVNNIKKQVYAQKLVGAHKKLQQADSEPFQVKLFVRFKHQEFHGLNRTNQNFIYCSWSNPEGCLEIFIIFCESDQPIQAVQFIPGVPGSGTGAAK